MSPTCTAPTSCGRLREAAAGFAAIGATGHARRLEAELAGDASAGPGGGYRP